VLGARNHRHCCWGMPRAIPLLYSRQPFIIFCLRSCVHQCSSVRSSILRKYEIWGERQYAKSLTSPSNNRVSMWGNSGPNRKFVFIIRIWNARSSTVSRVCGTELDGVQIYEFDIWDRIRRTHGHSNTNGTPPFHTIIGKKRTPFKYRFAVSQNAGECESGEYRSMLEVGPKLQSITTNRRVWISREAKRRPEVIIYKPTGHSTRVIHRREPVLSIIPTVASRHFERLESATYTFIPPLDHS
jgi:hypothetical protein